MRHAQVGIGRLFDRFIQPRTTRYRNQTEIAIQAIQPGTMNSTQSGAVIR